MNVLAVNSSPRVGSESKTELMLNHLIQGLEEGGASVTKIDLCRKKIHFCVGCFTCWTKTPGVCVHQDDMTREIFPAMIESDLMILASPLYHFTFNAQMKMMIERTLPILEPFFEQAGDRTTHPLRYQWPDTVVLSVAGFPEMGIFDELSRYCRYLFRQGGLVAEIYRPAAETLDAAPDRSARKAILNATVQAGRELAAEKRISSDTMAAITQSIGDADLIGHMANLFWKTCLAEGMTPREMARNNIMPRAETIQDVGLFMRMGFNPDAAIDVKATLQFRFTGPIAGDLYLTIDKGVLHYDIGLADDPDLTIETPFDLWLDMGSGKVDGEQALMAGRYTAHGDISLLMRMNQLFGARSQTH